MKTKNLSEKQEPFLIVGIGASAGGLAALKTLVQNLPKKTGMAYVIIQHLDPTHKSMLSELLAKECQLPVTDAQNKEVVKPNHIYVIPPDKYLELEEGKIKLSVPAVSRGSRKAIDHFFRSLARECGVHCAGIVLSGSGSDGTAGLRAIKAAGGLTLAQAPETAQHDNMPQSAIEANVIDKVAQVKHIPDLLSQYADHPLTLRDPKDASSSSVDQSLQEVTAILKTHEDFNLHQYKPSTVKRRIARRMSLTGFKNYKDYLEELRNNEDERRTLTKDLLINVTDFFRDPKAFEFLEKRVIPDILNNIDAKEDIRIWVAGCASGEEAYSIAILWLEAVSKARRKNHIKIFATDIDEHAVKTSRKGIYPESIAGEIPEKYIHKYFVKIENTNLYRIKNQVRDLISFAIQNVVTDPPFNHMHLISCRNLLIYLNKNIQEKVLSSFYFSLEGASYLFLGSSETLGGKSDFFKTLSKKWRIYKKIPGRNEKKVMLESLHIDQNLPSFKKGRSSSTQKKLKESLSRSDSIRSSLLDKFLPPTVIVDEQGQILYNHGDWKDYLRIPTGEPRNDITQLIIPSLRSRLRSALFKVKKNKEPLSFHGTFANKTNKKNRQIVRVEITLLETQEFVDGEAIAIVFHKEDHLNQEQKNIITKQDELTADQNLERELAETKEELQNTIEELETSTEELKASHEEALSTNEELQSANEELEASSEELRSLNEELSTVNAQLKEKIEQLQRANDDVENFFASTNLPTIFLDQNLKIQRYTPAAEHLLKMGPRDIDRDISSLGRDLVDDVLQEECFNVLQNFQPVRKEIESYDGRWFIRQITPYRTEDLRIQGVVLVFQDVTEIKELSERALAREKQQSVVAKLGIIALSGTDPEELMHQTVRQVAHVLDADYCKILKYQPEEHNFLLISGIGWHEGLIGKATVPSNQNSQSGYTLLAQEPVIVENLAKEKRFEEVSLLTDHNVVSGVSCIIDHMDPPYGVIGVHTKTYRKFTSDDANFIVSVANLLSTAVKTQKARETIKESEKRLQMAREAAKIGIHDYDVDTKNIQWDHIIRDIWGVSDNVDTITYEVYEAGLHPEDREQMKRNIDEALKKEGDYCWVYRVINAKDKKMRWVEATGKVIFKDGEAVRIVGTLQDITQRKKTQEDLAWSENKFRIAMETNNFGSFEYHMQKEQTHWDQLLIDIWGLKESEKPTQKIFWEGVHPDDQEVVAKKLEKAKDPNGDGHYRAVYRVLHRQTGELTWVEASGQTIFENGQALKMVGMLINITERKKLEESLQEAVAKLQEADQKKNQFLSVLGHELRNPLAVISGSVEILETRKVDTKKIFGLMKHSVQTMARLLDDLLDLNRISQNRIELVVSTVTVRGILERTVDAMKNVCDRKNQSISLHVDKPLFVNGDEVRLEQIFSNLIMNAYKYTPEGGKIEVNAEEIDQEIRVYVHDTGMGLDEEMLEKIFTPFFQVTQKGKTSYGLGIGLALSKELVELHKGTIKAYSEGKNRGSTFIVILPAQSQQGIDSDQISEQKTYQIKEGLKVLLIEDNEKIGETMPLLLENIGCEVRLAKTGGEGLALATSFNPDAMLVDIGLPDMTGHSVAKQLRESGYKGLLIAISGHSHTESRQKSQEVGFDHHLAKPAKISAIAKIIAEAFKNNS